ncbi:MAG: hypothetical protein LQ346_008898 [Caloplaca aetnensis]|nr:MAG: hypothetical protein LQ346_008898 [Caloplaca aetnensis]
MAPLSDMSNDAASNNSNNMDTDSNERNHFYLVWGSVLTLVAITIAIGSNKRFQTRVYKFMTKIVFGIGRTLGKAKVQIGRLIDKVFHAVSDCFRYPQQPRRCERAPTPAVKLQKIGHKKASKDSPASAASPAIFASRAVDGDVEREETQKKHETTSSTLGSEDITNCGFGIVATSVTGDNADGSQWNSSAERSALAEQDLSVREASEDYVRQGLMV